MYSNYGSREEDQRLMRANPPETYTNEPEACLRLVISCKSFGTHSGREYGQWPGRSLRKRL